MARFSAWNDFSLETSKLLYYDNLKLGPLGVTEFPNGIAQQFADTTSPRPNAD